MNYSLGRLEHEFAAGLCKREVCEVAYVKDISLARLQCERWPGVL